MNEQKNILIYLGEALDRYRAERRAMVQEPAPTGRQRWLRWLGRQMVPNIGTLLMVVVLLLTIPSLAAPLLAPSATSTSTISYQGRLADSGGNPLTGKYNLEFRIYDVPTSGTPLWTEMWTGANAVDVSDGLFNVMLGSIDNTLASSIEGHDELYLGITVGTDSEMEPRVQLGSVPFSFQAQQAMTVADRSITTDKIADGAVTQEKAPSLICDLANDNTVIQYGSENNPPHGTSVTFSQAFSEPPKVFITQREAVGGAGEYIVYSVTTTGFRIGHHNSFYGHVDWIAIGH